MRRVEIGFTEEEGTTGASSRGTITSTGSNMIDQCSAYVGGGGVRPMDIPDVQVQGQEDRQAGQGQGKEGVSQVDYDRVIAERDAERNRAQWLKDRLAIGRARGESLQIELDQVRREANDLREDLQTTLKKGVNLRRDREEIESLLKEARSGEAIRQLRHELQRMDDEIDTLILTKQGRGRCYQAQY